MPSTPSNVRRAGVYVPKEPRAAVSRRSRRGAGGGGKVGLVKGERAGGGQGAARRDARHEKTRQVAQRACSSDDGSGVGAAPEGDDGGRHGGGSGGKGHARGSAGQASVTRGGQAGARGMRGRRALAGRGTRGNDTGPPSRDAPHTAPAPVGGRARAIRDTRQRVARGRAPPPPDWPSRRGRETP